MTPQTLGAWTRAVPPYHLPQRLAATAGQSKWRRTYNDLNPWRLMMLPKRAQVEQARGVIVSLSLLFPARPPMAPNRELVGKCLIEFIGTGLLCFTVALAAGTSQPLAGIGIGSTLMCAIYFGGHISGANYNPAVSLALLVRGALPAFDFGCYVAAQLLGAATFGALVWPVALDTGAFGGIIGHPAKGAAASWVGALIAETVITFALCHVVLHTATTTFADGKSYYGLAIGFTVVSGAISVGGVSGGAFNPAVSMLTVIAGKTGSYSSIWLYWVGPLLGGALAGGLFRVTHPSEVDGTAQSGGGNTKPLLTDYIIEFVGTFLLAFTVGCAGGAALGAVSIGAMLMVNVYAGGPTSGGHYNPAVTVAVYLRATVFGKEDGLPLAKAGGYIVTQLLAGVVAGFTARATVGDHAFPNPRPDVNLVVAWYLELIATLCVLPRLNLPLVPARARCARPPNLWFHMPSSLRALLLLSPLTRAFGGRSFLAFVVLQTATAKATAGNSFFGLAIGFTVTAMATAVGPITGGALNPAVGMTGISGFLNTGAPPPPPPSQNLLTSPTSPTPPTSPSVASTHYFPPRHPHATGAASPWIATFAIYPTACPLGGALAACLYRYTNSAEFEKTGFTENTPLNEKLAAP